MSAEAPDGPELREYITALASLHTLHARLTLVGQLEPEGEAPHWYVQATISRDASSWRHRSECLEGRRQFIKHGGAAIYVSQM
jgi:hypothetical protein